MLPETIWLANRFQKSKKKKKEIVAHFRVVTLIQPSFQKKKNWRVPGNRCRFKIRNPMFIKRTPWGVCLWHDCKGKKGGERAWRSHEKESEVTARCQFINLSKRKKSKIMKERNKGWVVKICVGFAWLTVIRIKKRWGGRWVGVMDALCIDE